MSVSTGMSTCTSTSVSESARARVGREAGVCVSDARCQMPATERGPWGGYYLRLEALKRLAPKRYSYHSRHLPCCVWHARWLPVPRD